jgi:hypothetical protein
MFEEKIAKQKRNKSKFKIKKERIKITTQKNNTKQ